MAATAQDLKAQGNSRFGQGDYTGAEALYSKAIIADSKIPALFTNRANARLKLSLWDAVVADCNACIELSKDNMKAHYYRGQAEFELATFDSALSSALCAHRLCVKTSDNSLPQVTALVLKCKNAAWEAQEKRRPRKTAELERVVLDMMKQGRLHDLQNVEGSGERDDVEREWEERLVLMKEMFNKTRDESEKRREAPPSWAMDDISFNVMLDPVMTKTGKSYERASIVQHLQKSQTDPLTREPLAASELRPNINLREACQEYLEQNGWAADW